MASLAFLMMKTSSDEGDEVKNDTTNSSKSHHLEQQKEQLQHEEAPSMTTRQRKHQRQRSQGRSTAAHGDGYYHYQKQQQQHAIAAAQSSSVLGSMSQAKYSTEMILQYPSSPASGIPNNNRRRITPTAAPPSLQATELIQRRPRSKISVPPLASPTRHGALGDEDDELLVEGKSTSTSQRRDLLSNHRQGSQGILDGIRAPSLPPSKLRLLSFFKPPPVFTSSNPSRVTTATTIEAPMAAAVGTKTMLKAYSQMAPPKLEYCSVKQPYSQGDKQIRKHQSTADWANSFVYKPPQPPQSTFKKDGDEHQLKTYQPSSQLSQVQPRFSITLPTSSTHILQSKFSTSCDAQELYNTFRKRSFQVSSVALKLEDLKLPPSLLDDDNDHGDKQQQSFGRKVSGKNALDATCRSSSTLSSLSNETSSTAFWHMIDGTTPNAKLLAQLPPLMSQQQKLQRPSEVLFTTSKEKNPNPPRQPVRVPTTNSTNSATANTLPTALNARVSVGTAPPPIPTVSMRDLLYESGLLDAIDYSTGHDEEYVGYEAEEGDAAAKEDDNFDRIQSDKMPRAPIRKDTPLSSTTSRDDQDNDEVYDNHDQAPQRPVRRATASTSNQFSSYSSMTSSCSMSITTRTTLNYDDGDTVEVDMSALRRRPNDNSGYKTKDDTAPIPPLRRPTTSSRESAKLMSPIREMEHCGAQGDSGINDEESSGPEMAISEPSSTAPKMMYTPPSIHNRKAKNPTIEAGAVVKKADHNTNQDRPMEVRPQTMQAKQLSASSASTKSSTSIGPASVASSKADQQSISKIVDRVLQRAVRDMLSMDEQEPLYCTCVGSAASGGNPKVCVIHGRQAELPLTRGGSLDLNGAGDPNSSNDIDLSDALPISSAPDSSISELDRKVANHSTKTLYPDMPAIHPHQKLYPDMPSLAVILETPSQHSRSIQSSNSSGNLGRPARANRVSSLPSVVSEATTIIDDDSRREAWQPKQLSEKEADGRENESHRDASTQSSGRYFRDLTVHSGRTSDDKAERTRHSIDSESTMSKPWSEHYRDIPLYGEGVISLQDDEGLHEYEKILIQSNQPVMHPYRKKSWQADALSRTCSLASSIFSVDENEAMEFASPAPMQTNNDSISSLRGGLKALPIRVSTFSQDSSIASDWLSMDSSRDSLHYSSSCRSFSVSGLDEVLHVDPTSKPQNAAQSLHIGGEADKPGTCDSNKQTFGMTTSSVSGSTVSEQRSVDSLKDRIDGDEGMSSGHSRTFHEVPVDQVLQFDPKNEPQMIEADHATDPKTTEREEKSKKSGISQDTSLLSGFSAQDVPKEVRTDIDTQGRAKISVSSVTESLTIESQEKLPLPPKQDNVEPLQTRLPSQFHEVFTPSYIPTSIVGRLDSIHTIQSTFSEVTVPWELKSPMIKSPMRVPRGLLCVESPMRFHVGGSYDSSGSSVESSALPPPPLRPFKPTNSITPSSPEPVKPARKVTESIYDSSSEKNQKGGNIEISFDEFDSAHLTRSRSIPRHPRDVMPDAVGTGGVNTGLSSTSRSTGNTSDSVPKLYEKVATIFSVDENKSMKFDYPAQPLTDSPTRLQTRPIRLSALSEAFSVASDYRSAGSSYDSHCYSESLSFVEVPVHGIPQFDPTKLISSGEAELDGYILPKRSSRKAHPRAAVPPPDVDEVNTPITCNSHKRPSRSLPSSANSSIMSEYSGDSAALSREELMLSEAKTPISRNSHKRISKQSSSSRESSLDEVPEDEQAEEEDMPQNMKSQCIVDPHQHVPYQEYGQKSELPEQKNEDEIQSTSNGAVVPASVYGRIDSIRTVQTAVSEVTTPWELKTPNVLRSPMRVPRGIFRIGSSAQISIGDSLGSDSTETQPPLLAVRPTMYLAPLSPGPEPPSRILRPTMSLTPASPELGAPNRIMSTRNPSGLVQKADEIPSAPPDIIDPQFNQQRPCYYPPSPYGNRKVFESKTPPSAGPTPNVPTKGDLVKSPSPPVSNTSSKKSSRSRCDSPGLPATGVPVHMNSFIGKGGSNRSGNRLNGAQNNAESPLPGLPFGDDVVSDDGSKMNASTGNRTMDHVDSFSEQLLIVDGQQQHANLEGPLRVKHDPRQICFIESGYAYVRDGFYSGALDNIGDMHGNGVFWFATTDDLYLGEFSHGELHGIGALSIRVMENGNGKSKRPKNRILKGHWEHNEFMGEEFLS